MGDSISSYNGMGLGQWLDAVDAQWLKSVSRTPRRPDKGVREFLNVLEEQYDSVGQILEIYHTRDNQGRSILNDEFFHDTGISKLGHKRMFNRWVTESVSKI